jgi:hypothetical protein
MGEGDLGDGAAEVAARARRGAWRVAGVALLVVGCGGAPTGGDAGHDLDGTPPNRSSAPQPTADSPPAGGAGGPGAVDPLGTGTGGITGTGAP